MCACITTQWKHCSHNSLFIEAFQPRMLQLLIKDLFLGKILLSNHSDTLYFSIANCGHPESQLLSTNDSVPRVDGLDDILPIGGSTVTFSCPPGLVLIGLNSATCTENGEWEPDLSELMCTGKSCLLCYSYIPMNCSIIVACEHPLLNQSVGSSLYILDYSEPAVVGTTVSFNCSEPGEVLTDPNTATCMEDGLWVPDPNQLQISCKGDSRCMLSLICSH